MKEKTHYTTNELRKIVRMEDIGSEIWCPDVMDKITFDGIYNITSEDLQASLQTIIDKNLTCEDVLIWWDILNNNLMDGLGPKQCLDAVKGNCLIENKSWYEFPEGEAGVIYYLWNYLFDVMIFEINEKDEDEPAGQVQTLKNSLDYITCFLKNRDLPKEKWVYPEFIMENFIDQFDDDEILARASEAEKKRFALWVDHLAAKDNTRALHARCYGKYTGNAVYEQDFQAARDDAEKLFELTQNPQYANTLGYIYYYGRVDGGEPQYDKALTYFTFGAANGVYESIYKLSDMYKNGYGVIKSPETAYHLVRMLYDDISVQYEEGTGDFDFADVALRLGSMKLHGVGTQQNIYDGIAFLLQAEYAIKKRMAEHDYYGDNVVAANIAGYLADIKEAYPPEKNMGQSADKAYWAIDRLMADGYAIGFRAKELKNGEWSVTFHRIPKRREDKPKKSFFVIPPLYYCEFTDTIKGQLRPVGGEMPAFGKTDDFDIVYQDGQAKTIFYDDGEPLFSVMGDTFDWRFPKPKEKSGKTVRLAGITFTPGGKQYDYLCDDEDIDVGDTVTVVGYDRETEVTVQNIRVAAVEDLALPLEKYKKVTKRKKH